MSFENVNLSGVPPHYTKDLESERVLNGWKDALSGSLCETFSISGSVTDNVGLYLDGARYNDGCTRTITGVTIQCVNSGSGGVTRVDVRKSVPGPMLTDKSIFSHQEFRPALSSSAGDFGVGRTTTVIAASASWARGEQVAVSVLASAGAAGYSAQTGLTVRIWWKPA